MAKFMGWEPGFTKYFGQGGPEIEKLQKPWPVDASYELVETSMFGFSIPEESLTCEIYHWLHPKFNVASGGVFIFRGKTLHQFTAEFFDQRNYQPMPDDITDCTYVDGLTVRMIEPQQEFELTFDDPKTQTSFHVNQRAIMPPAFRPNGGHITQAMRTQGTLTLHGKTYTIDGYFTRDRSWGDSRTEAPQPIPAAGWHVGVFGDDLAFHVMGFDSPDLNPAMAARYPAVKPGSEMIWGYLWKNGQLLGLKSCRKLTKRHEDGLIADRVDMELTDENDDVWTIHGELLSWYPLSLWPNFNCAFGMTRWTLGDRVGYGDTQEALYSDFVRENLRIANPSLATSRSGH